jgi:hypothetical protein
MRKLMRTVSRALVLALLLSISMATSAGNFFPPEYKQFPFKEGDLLVSKRSDGKYAVNKILKVDRFDFKAGASINIQGQRFVATEDDYLLIVSASYGESEFGSFEEAKAAAQSGRWTVKLGHAPNRAPGAASGLTLVGHSAVSESELTGYRQWRAAFERGDAGVF